MMAVPSQQKTSFDDFLVFIQQPEQSEQFYEFIDGQHVEVHTPNKVVKLYDATMTLPGGDVLPGFELLVKDIFPAENMSEA